MLDCRACISRCIRTIFADVLHGSPRLLFPQRSNRVLRNGRYPVSAQRRYHAAVRVSQASHKQTVNTWHRSQGAARRQSTEASPAPEAWSGLPYYPPPSYDGTEKTSSKSLVPCESHNVSERNDKALDRTKKKRLERELVWLQDPLKLAENTISLLKDNRSEKAIHIVRMASKKASCVVSWNHLIDYEMSKGSVQKAVKIYNEVGNPVLIRL